jgi:hypothetical protein
MEPGVDTVEANYKVLWAFVKRATDIILSENRYDRNEQTIDRSIDQSNPRPLQQFL